MTDDHIKDHQGLPNKAKDAAPTAPDNRDAVIERLERAVAEEREHAAMLRKTAEELRFKARVLEKSYAKQLEDARMCRETAERELADQQARMAALDSAREDAMRLLAETRTELERITADRDKLRKALASTDGMQIKTIAQDNTESRAEDSLLTINRLMKDSSLAGERRPVGREKEHADAQVRAGQESPSEELIAPELVFTVKGK